MYKLFKQYGEPENFEHFPSMHYSEPVCIFESSTMDCIGRIFAERVHETVIHPNLPADAYHDMFKFISINNESCAALIIFNNDLTIRFYIEEES